MEERSENIVMDIYQIEGCLNELRALELNILIERTLLINNFLLRKFNHIIYRLKRKLLENKQITRNSQL